MNIQLQSFPKAHSTRRETLPNDPNLSVAMCGVGLGITISMIVFCVGCVPSPVATLNERSQEWESTESVAEHAPLELSQRIDRVLTGALEARTLSADVNAAWQIMHAVICYGDELEIEAEGEQVAALDYALAGGFIEGFELKSSGEMMKATGREGVQARFDPGSYIGQGHVDQWLAICAMAKIPMEREIQIDGRTFTIEDWARQTQFDVSRNLVDEYSWTLIALTHYFPDEASWECANDMVVDLESLVAVELDYDIDSSACGGTHRLAGIIAALNAKQRMQLPDSEVWTKAKQVVEERLQNIQINRNGDGCLSSYYFFRSGATRDLFAQLSSTGHLFEFVALAAERAQLQEAWVEQSAHRLCELIEQTAVADLDCGALYHALHGLKVYRERRFPSGG
ncbi:MAG: ADP-ribosylation factor-directed GTPase activating protein isoform b [Aureliella sp.]